MGTCMTNLHLKPGFYCKKEKRPKINFGIGTFVLQRLCVNSATFAGAVFFWGGGDRCRTIIVKSVSAYEALSIQGVEEKVGIIFESEDIKILNYWYLQLHITIGTDSYIFLKYLMAFSQIVQVDPPPPNLTYKLFCFKVRFRRIGVE